VSDDLLADRLPPEPTRAIIGQIAHHLSRMAEMLYAIDEAGYEYHRRTAFVDAFLLDFRALSYFLWGGKSTEVRCYDFVDIKKWQPPKTDATKRMHKLVVIVSKHRAHLSWSRFVPTHQDLEQLDGIPRFSAEFLGQVLLDLLDILDDFISQLPDDKQSGKRAWISAAYAPRYKTEVALDLRESDDPDNLMPLKSVHETVSGPD
jgi:hypothetical protein